MRTPTALTSSTSLTVPFPTNATSLVGPLPGLSAGPVSVQVYNQTGPNTYSLVGSIPLTVADNRPPPAVTGITPNPIDLANPPEPFSIAGQRFESIGFGLPVVNFTRGGTLLAQARATALTGSTSLTVSFPTNATSLVGPLPGLSAGPVSVQVYNQTGPNTYLLVGSVPLTVTDSRAQVRFFHNLLICNPGCQAFTARLTASEGYTWFAFSGNYSPYQPVTTPTLSNFQGEAVGFPGATFNFPGTFAIARGQRYALVVTLNASNNLVLLLINVGPLGASSAPQELGVSEATLPGQRGDDPTIRFAPAGEAPSRQ